MTPRLLTALAVVGVALLAPAPARGAAPSPGTPRSVALWSSPLGNPPTVIRGFDPPADPFGRGHRGVDLLGRPGLPVRAAGDGVVAFAGRVAGRPVVSIAHPGGLRTTYEPVSPGVAAGRHVPAGTVIGTLLAGHAGCPAAACLHWGLRRGGTYLDPLALLRPPRVRLLPWDDAPP